MTNDNDELDENFDEKDFWAKRVQEWITQGKDMLKADKNPYFKVGFLKSMLAALENDFHYLRELL